MNIRYPIYEGVYRILTLKYYGRFLVFYFAGRGALSFMGLYYADFYGCLFSVYII